jgi:hypothetical protein
LEYHQNLRAIALYQHNKLIWLNINFLIHHAFAL